MSDFIEEGYREQFGMSRSEAWTQSVCVSCKQPVHSGPPGEKGAVQTPAGQREWGISALCETCFDEMFDG